MSVSFKKAMKAPFLEKYNKVNIAFYAIISAVFWVFYLYYDFLKKAIKSGQITNSSETALISLLCICVFLFTSIIISGYTAIFNHNEFKNSTNPFPSFSDIGKILNKGFKFFFGFILLVLIFTIPIAVLSGFLAGVASGFAKTEMILFFIIFGLLIIAYSLFIAFRFLIPLCLIFFRTLKFKSLFAFGKISKFLNARKGNYIPFVLKNIGISIIEYVLETLLSVIVSVIIAIILLSSNIPKELKGIIISSIITSIIGSYFIVVRTNLSAQFVNIQNKEIQTNEQN